MKCVGCGDELEWFVMVPHSPLGVLVSKGSGSMCLKPDHPASFHVADLSTPEAAEEYLS